MTETTKATPRKPRVQADLAKFAREGESIIVANELPTIAILVIKQNGDEQISEFAAKGDPSGEDVMELPSVYLRVAQFRKQLQLGVFRLVDADDPGVLSAFENQQRAWEAQNALREETDRFIDAQQPRAFSGKQCLAQEGRNQCSEYAIFGNNEREVPPLCSKHAHLRSQFTPEETGTFTDGKPDIRWNRVSILGR